MTIPEIIQKLDEMLQDYYVRSEYLDVIEEAKDSLEQIEEADE